MYTPKHYDHTELIVIKKVIQYQGYSIDQITLNTLRPNATSPISSVHNLCNSTQPLSPLHEQHHSLNKDLTNKEDKPPNLFLSRPNCPPCRTKKVVVDLLDSIVVPFHVPATTIPTSYDIAAGQLGELEYIFLLSIYPQKKKRK